MSTGFFAWECEEVLMKESEGFRKVCAKNHKDGAANQSTGAMSSPGPAGRLL